MRMVSSSTYQENPSQWKESNFKCKECGVLALGKVDNSGMIRSGDFYFPCGHPQFYPPELSMPRRKRRKRQTEVLFDL
jgi:hypothetical protein